MTSKNVSPSPEIAKRTKPRIVVIDNWKQAKMVRLRRSRTKGTQQVEILNSYRPGLPPATATVDSPTKKQNEHQDDNQQGSGVHVEILLAAFQLFGRLIEFFPVISKASYKLSRLFSAKTVLARKIVDFVFLVSCDAAPVRFAYMGFIVGHGILLYADDNCLKGMVVPARSLDLSSLLLAWVRKTSLDHPCSLAQGEALAELGLSQPLHKQPELHLNQTRRR